MMTDDPGYSENIRRLTTAAESDDAVTAGKILNQLGPERWDKAVKDMLTLNQKDVSDFVPRLSVAMDKTGTSETLTVYQQPRFELENPLAVAKVSRDITETSIPNPLDPKTDVIRQLTSAAE